MTKTLKKHQTSVTAGLVLIALLVVYFYRENLKTAFQKNTILPSNAATLASTESSSVSASSSNNASNDTPLKKGSTGEKVKELQRLINVKHQNYTPRLAPNLVVDGQFGTKTEILLKKYTGKTSISINELIKALK